MRAMLRYMLTGSASVAVTMLMFYMMTLLIATDSRTLVPSEEQPAIKFVDALLPDPPPTRKPRPEPPEPRNLPQPEVAINTPQPEVNMDMPEVDRSSMRPGNGTGLIKGMFTSLPESGTDADPFALTTIRPQYPQHAARNEIEGWVTIEFVVTANGKVTDAHVIASEPARVFDDAALKGIMKWTFKPALKNGQPVSRRAIQTLAFRLDEK